jgi:hypothetical protein
MTEPLNLREIEQRNVQLKLQLGLNVTSDDVDALIALVRDSLEYTQHQPGCSGMYPPHRCKCGFAEFRARVKDEAQP